MLKRKGWRHRRKLGLRRWQPLGRNEDGVQVNRVGRKGEWSKRRILDRGAA
jgi:hypothetical protein